MLPTHLGQSLAVLKHRDFTLFFSALLVAAVGSQIQTFANILQIYDLTHSPFHIGLTGLARAIPLIGLSLIGGVVADRVDRRRLIMMTQAGSCGLALLLAALSATETLQVWHIYAVTVAGSALMALNAPARGAMIPGLVSREHLMPAFALNSTTWQLANIVGPSIAGVAVAVGGFTATYLLNGLALGITLICMAIIRPRPTEARRRQSTLNSIKEGLAFVRFRTIILALLALDSAAMLFGTYRVVLPSIGEQLGLTTQQLGLLFAAPGIGSLVGAAFVMALGDVRYKGVLIVGAILAYCGCLVLLAISPWFLMALLVGALLEFFDSLQATPRNTLIQSMAPDEIRGRVESFRQMLTGGMPALGQVYMGATASLLGAQLALIVGALTCAAAVIGIASGRRDIRDRDLGEEPLPAIGPTAPGLAPAPRA